jgi:hypothetical protein
VRRAALLITVGLATFIFTAFPAAKWALFAVVGGGLIAMIAPYLSRHR